MVAEGRCQGSREHWLAFIPIQVSLQFIKYLVKVYNTLDKEGASEKLFERECLAVRV